MSGPLKDNIIFVKMKTKGILRTLVNDSQTIYSVLEDRFKEPFSYYLMEKTKRLSEAIYLATNHITDKEKIKNRIREFASEIIILSVSSVSSRDANKNICLQDELLSKLILLSSLLEVLTVDGLISNPNFGVINREILNLYSEISSRDRNRKGILEDLPTSFFGVEIKETGYQKENFLKDKTISKTIKDISDLSVKDEEDMVEIITDNNEFYDFDTKEIDNQYEIKKDNFSHKGQNYDKRHISDKVSLKKAERQNREGRILGYFTVGKKVSIKDIKLFMPQVGEKTIQRILIKLIGEKKLAKEGGKRWTSYYLPN